jgi:ABC-type multidrug transport system fused ATPase/permease subunit
MDMLRNTTTADRHRGLRTPLPPTIFGYIRRFTLGHQLALAALSIVAFLLSAAPLELQRRIVNDTINQGAVASIVWLALGYAGVAFAEGAVKLVMNIYRGWVSENAVRQLRNAIHTAMGTAATAARAEAEGVEVSLILSEVKPIGGFIGVSTSEPLLQGGILLSVFGYMIFLQPEIALVSLLVFSPQLIFVPWMQFAINRRVETRIRVLRDVGSGIIASTDRHDNGEAIQKGLIDVVLTLNMGIYKLKFTMNFLMNLLHHLGIAVVLAVGGWYAATGRTDVGTVVAFISGLAKLNDPWGDIVNWFRDATTNGVKYRLVADAVQASRLVSDAETTNPPPTEANRGHTGPSSSIKPTGGNDAASLAPAGEPAFCRRETGLDSLLSSRR